MPWALHLLKYSFLPEFIHLEKTASVWQHVLPLHISVRESFISLNKVENFTKIKGLKHQWLKQDANFRPPKKSHMKYIHDFKVVIGWMNSFKHPLSVYYATCTTKLVLATNITQQKSSHLECVFFRHSGKHLIHFISLTTM